MPRSPFFLAPALMLLALSGAPALAQEPTPEIASKRSPFVAPDFAMPTQVEGPGFKLVPLGPALVDIDFAAYMSSISHLQQTFTRSTCWPREGITAEEAMADMLTEQGRFERRESFAYAVLTPDGSRERGCVYVAPAKVRGHDAEIRLWVTKAEYDAGFDAQLYAWTQDWIAREWRFASPVYPGRSVSWEQWDALVAGQASSSTSQ